MIQGTTQHREPSPVLDVKVIEVTILGYSRNDILIKSQTSFKDVKTFYKQPFINYNGKTSDTDEFYTEIIAAFLCKNISDFENGIPKITREITYKTVGHDGCFNIDTPREEEKIAMEMYKQSLNGCVYDFIGEMIDYQTPLKNKRTDAAGKIDLLSYDGSTLYILELKKPDSEESMLRCVLEGYTYMKNADHKKLLKDFGLPEDTIIKASPFVFKDMIQHKQMREKRPYLFKLMSLLDSKPFYITKEKNIYKVEE